MNSLVKFEERG